MHLPPHIILIIVLATLVGSAALFYLGFGKLPIFISLRYLFSRKKQNAINIITGISILGITFVTAALILVLSIFNGFQSLIEDLFSSFDPDLKIEAALGRTLPYSEETLKKIQQFEGVEFVSATVENKAMIGYGDKQHIVAVKGVREDYLKISPVDTLVYDGEYRFVAHDGYPACILGGGVAGFINANLLDDIHPIELLVALESGDFLKNPESAIKTESFFPAGYFSVQIEYDNKYVLVGFQQAQKLFGYEGKCTAYEVKLKDKDQADQVKAGLAQVLGKEFIIRTWYEQHETLYKVMQNEKLVAYLVLALILLLAGINIVGSLSMTVLEKTRDIAVLMSFGAHKALLSRVFLALGFMIGALGGMAGTLIGLVVGYLQQAYGIVKLSGGDSFLISAYPLEMRVGDFILIFLTVFGLSLLAAWLPARRAAQISISTALRD
ncbi:MAG: ABC transporter permease [Bacteroidia bacterium]|nr:ABC transporter permease [Bacteroidia bacterium]